MGPYIRNLPTLNLIALYEKCCAVWICLCPKVYEIFNEIFMYLTCHVQRPLDCVWYGSEV